MPSYNFEVPRSRGTFGPQTVAQVAQATQAATETVNGLIVLASIARIAFTDQEVEELVATLTDGVLELSTAQDRLDALTDSISVGPKLRQFFGWLTRSQELVAVVAGTSGSAQTLSNSFSAALIDASVGPMTVLLPAAADVNGRSIVIKKIDATRNKITVAAVGLDTIDGVASFIVDIPNESYTLLSSGSAWYVI